MSKTINNLILFVFKSCEIINTSILAEFLFWDKYFLKYSPWHRWVISSIAFVYFYFKIHPLISIFFSYMTWKLEIMCVLCLAQLWLFRTLWTLAHQIHLSMGSQARILEWSLRCSPQGIFLTGIKSTSPPLQIDSSSLTEPPGKPKIYARSWKKERERNVWMKHIFIHPNSMDFI